MFDENDLCERCRKNKNKNYQIDPKKCPDYMGTTYLSTGKVKKFDCKRFEPVERKFPR